MYDELLDFLNGEHDFFIEIEAKPDKMEKFLNDYNRTYGGALTFGMDGILLLQEDANKWAHELRLYVRNRPPVNVMALGFSHNNAYRNDYSYRLNDNRIITFLFDQGYRIGVN